jgi:plasmid stability protein
MAHFLVREMDEQVLQRLKARAARHKTSLQQEVKAAIARGSAPTAEDRRAALAELQQLWGKHPPLTAGGAEIVREVRDEAEEWS